MAGEIITVRHGRPALSRRVILSAQDYGEWWQKYDESGLMTGQIPPDSLLELTRHATQMFSSTMPRAIETANFLTADNIPVQIEVLFVEAPLPPPPWPNWIKMSPQFWGATSRVYWNAGYVTPGMETKAEAWRRVDKIIDRLSENLKDGRVVLCAHGYLNWMIDRRLRARGLTRIEHNGGHKYWSYRRYQSH